MRVIQINSSCQFGSTGRIVVGISRALNDHNIDNTVFYSGNRISSYPNGVLINKKIDIRVHQLQSRITGKQGCHSTYTTRRLISEIKKIEPDLIHLHNLHGYYLNIPLLFEFLSQYGRPVVWTLHDCWAFTGHCTHYFVQKCTKWKTKCHSCPLKRSYPYSWIFDRSLELFQMKKDCYNRIPQLSLVAVSQWLSEQVKQSKLLSERQTIVIPNGIDLSTFKPGRKLSKIGGKNVVGKEIILGVANNWGPNKGFDDFCQLSRIIKENWVVIMVGLSDDQIRGLPDSIIGLARTDSIEELVDLYSSALVTFSASTEETFGLVILESLACGTPVIAYDSTACAELVREECGFLVEPHALQKVVRRIEEIERMGKKVYSEKCTAVAKTYSDNEMYQKYIELYEEVVKCNEEQNRK